MITQASGANPTLDFKTCAVACLQAPHDAQAAARARACLADPAFDWDGFLTYIRREGVSPLIHAAFGNFATGGWGSLPPGLAARIQKDYLHSIWINDRRLEDLRQILSQMDVAGVPVTLLKGAALFCTLYEKRGLRPMTDIDLLVPPEHFARAGGVLLSCGYEKRDTFIYSGDALKEIGYQKPGQPDSAIDLHCALFSAPHRLTAGQSAWFWQSRERAIYDGMAVWTFKPTAQLLHLCAHLWFGHSHEGDNLLRLHDIDRLIRSHACQIDWTGLLAVAEAFELLLPLQQTLPELEREWQSPLPEGFCTKLVCLTPTAREQRKFGRHFVGAQSYLQTLLGHTLSYPDWRGRLRYAWRFIFPPWQYILWRYNLRGPLLVPYYYAYRLVSRAIQQVRRLL